jgi:hypothetical protein
MPLNLVISTEGMDAIPTMQHSIEGWGRGEQMDETKVGVWLWVIAESWKAFDKNNFKPHE